VISRSWQTGERFEKRGRKKKRRRTRSNNGGKGGSSFPKGRGKGEERGRERSSGRPPPPWHYAGEIVLEKKRPDFLEKSNGTKKGKGVFSGLGKARKGRPALVIPIGKAGKGEKARKGRGKNEPLLWREGKRTNGSIFSYALLAASLG